ncbi:hypothetical protein [Chryseobacterium indoltheticum]|uniref:hypothetical protein n=1 Tax=Chryseobacterium indoltheticum TaxID=254 RepID=UPI003F498BD5
MERTKKGLKPTNFTIENALERIKEKGDLFKPVLGKGIDMMKALEMLENLRVSYFIFIMNKKRTANK